MKKIKQNTNSNKSWLLLIIGLFLVISLFGGLTINKMQKQNLALAAKQDQLETKIADLQGQVAENQNQVASLSTDLTKSKDDVTYYKKMTLALKKQLDDNLAQAQVATPVDQAITLASVKPVTKTVTKKVYVAAPTVYVAAPAKHETSVTVQGVGSYKVDVASGDTAFTVLKKASKVGGFPMEYTDYSFGTFVTSIGDTKPKANEYWAFYYNGNFSDVGASDQKISDNDTTFWRLETF